MLSIKSLEPIYSNAFSKSSSGQKFEEMDMLVSGMGAFTQTSVEGLDAKEPPAVMSLYTDRRDFINKVESVVKSKPDLEAACAQSDPDKYFMGKKTRAGNGKLVTNGEKDTLLNWLKVISMDSVRGMSMKQVCMALLGKSKDKTAQEVLDEEWKQLQDIYAKLKTEEEDIAKGHNANGGPKN